jgi:hypothetical protein
LMVSVDSLRLAAAASVRYAIKIAQKESIDWSADTINLVSPRLF